MFIKKILLKIELSMEINFAKENIDEE